VQKLLGKENGVGVPGGERENAWECVSENENEKCSILCVQQISFSEQATSKISYLLRFGLESPSKCSTSMSDILVWWQAEELVGEATSCLVPLGADLRKQSARQQKAANETLSEAIYIIQDKQKRLHFESNNIKRSYSPRELGDKALQVSSTIAFK
jgi:hypothetical protein